MSLAFQPVASKGTSQLSDEVVNVDLTTTVAGTNDVLRLIFKGVPKNQPVYVKYGAATITDADDTDLMVFPGEEPDGIVYLKLPASQTDIGFLGLYGAEVNVCQGIVVGPDV